MAMGMSSGQGVPFYDPFYKVNTQRSASGLGVEEANSRYYDDFNVFNSVHISKPQRLSLNIPSRPAPAQGATTSGAAVFSSLAKSMDEGPGVMPVASILPTSGVPSGSGKSNCS